jgi:hypothetical protein
MSCSIATIPKSRTGERGKLRLSRNIAAIALATGGRDNGEPGLRGDYGPNYLAAFVIEPDGYRIEAYCLKG